MNRLKISMIIASALVLASCSVDDPIYETAHPQHGKITVAADWSVLTGNPVNPTRPTEFTVVMGDKSHTFNTQSQVGEFPHTINPGSYRVLAHHVADKITIADKVATVGTITRAAAEVDANPGWLFTAAVDVNIEKDKVHTVTAIMQQQVRQLTFIIEPTGGSADRISSIAAELSGVARSWNFDANQAAGDAATVKILFSKITSGTNTGKWTATVRLLGVTGTEQKLSGTIAYTDGIPASHTLESNLSAVLTGFNNDKKTPLTLSATVVETPTEMGFTSIITSWELGNVESGNAE